MTASSITRIPTRGAVWLADLGSTRGREQAGRRPVLIVSDDRLNSGPRGLIIVAPITSRLRSNPFHVVLQPPDGGLDRVSVVMCEQVRSISLERFEHRLGSISLSGLREVEALLRALLGLREEP